MESFVPRGSPGKIYKYFPRRKPPRVRTYDFRQCKHIHIVLTVRLFETLLDDFVVSSLLPRHLRQTCQAADSAYCRAAGMLVAQDPVRKQLN